MQYRRFDIKGEIIVVAFDICSSSNVLEQLTLAGDFSCVTELLTEIKRFLASEQSTLPVSGCASHRASKATVCPQHRIAKFHANQAGALSRTQTRS